MIIETACLAAGPVISGAVSVFKRIPIVKKYPKSVAMLLSIITGSVTSTIGSMPGIEWYPLVECTLIPFAGAIATYEAGTRQLKKHINIGDGE
jgi:hypothetical protein